MNPLSAIWKKAKIVFMFLSKGARLDAALIWAGKTRSPTGIKWPKEGAIPEIIDGTTAWNADDIMQRWSVTTRAKLRLKNNSTFHAYNVQLINADEIFAEFEKLPKLTSIPPDGSLDLDVSFRSYGDFLSGLDADKMPEIPKEIENAVLYITYENEAATKLVTKFWVSFSNSRNEYTYAPTDLNTSKR